MEKKHNFNILASENPYRQQIGFTEFIKKIAPETTGTKLPEVAQALTLSLLELCPTTGKKSPGIIRGGAMRTFLLDNYETDDRFFKIFENADLGPIADKAFSSPKDIDIFLRYEGNHKKFHEKNIMLETIKNELIRNSYVIINTDPDGNRITLSNGSQEVVLTAHKTGVKHRQALVKVDFFEQNKARMKLDFGLIPDKNEKGEDPRYFDEAADIDKLAIGYLTGENHGITVNYLGYQGVNLVDIFLRTNFFEPIRRGFKADFSKKPDQVLMAKLREINFRVAMIPYLFSVIGINGIAADLQQTPFYKLFIKYGMNFERKAEESKKLNGWFKENESAIQDHSKLISSDIFYGLTVNPFIFFLLAYPTHVMDAFPLGKDLEFRPLMNILQHIAEKSGGNIITDSLMSLSFKYYLSLKSPQDTAVFRILEYLGKPQKMSEFIDLIDTLRVR